MIGVEEITQTGRYRKIEEPRNGGSVYEAYDSVLETNVVLREIPVRLGKITSLGQQEAIRDAFAEEAKVFTAIKHESIQRVLDFFSDLDRHCLIMESISGSDLGELLEKKRGAFPLHDIMNWADQLLDALHYLHTYAPPVFHRNVKPQNLKLTPGGKIKLLACSFTKDTDAPTGSDLNYLSLEQIWNGLDPASQKVITNSYDERSEKLLRQPADARSDIYSVGATLYHLITGCVPIDPLERSIDTLDGKTDPLRSASALDPGVPPEISDVLMRAMEIKRENRYDSAVIMRQVLRTALVRVKERETLDAVKQDEMNAAWEASLAEEKRLGEERSIEEERQNAIEAERAAAEEEHRLAEQLRLEAEAEKERLEEERRLTEQRRLELEAEKKRQADLVREQLREAEEQRSEAQQRAAEAERRLFDKELENFVDKDVIAYFDPELATVEPGPVLAVQSEPLVAVDSDPLEVEPEPVEVAPEAVEVEPEPDILEVPAEDFEPRLASDEKEFEKKAAQRGSFSGRKEVELGGMFAEQKEAGSRWKVPVAVLSFVLAGGASFYGVSTFLSSKSIDTKQPAAAVISVNDSVQPEPAIQNSALPVTETSPAPASASENPAAEPAPAAVIPGQSAPRNKPVAEPAAPVKKPAAPAKTPAAKKPVTVDDLIKDN
jgi:serine/threonine protein kinase